ncbi:cytochrome P450 CYP12A2-like [Cydia pomonella]|uniref:cytochrome P450 CYP12A2-like n=1 Tax=Cydia pomonella TaxID=82600 RepID=UPI002ADD768C|nr:cytochrome P450 CYP12A2-like [Cydia pomonella]
MQTLRVRVFNSSGVGNKIFLRNAVTSTDAETQNLRPWKEIPGPTSLPIIGSLFSFLPGGKLYGHKGVKLSERLYQLYGPIVRFDGVFGGQAMIQLFHPEAIEHVLRSEEPMPLRPGLQTLEYYRKRHNKIYDPTRITGLASDHGETWRDFRTKVNPIMMQPKTIKLYTNVLEEVSNDLVARLKSFRDENKRITKKFNVEMNLWSLESIGVVALGTRLNCFDPSVPDDSPAKKLIQNVHDIFNIAEKLDFGVSPWRLFSTPMFKKAMKIYEEHERITKYFIDQGIKRLEESKRNAAESSNSEKPILEKLLEIDFRIAHIMASDMLLAGVDTAANTAIATLYLLAINPEKQDKLREEIMSKQTRKPYLRAVIKESMRILPVANGNVRLATKEYNLLGYKIPKDVLIVFSHQYMSNMATNYPRPDEYIPERWLAEKDDPLYYGNTHPFVMAPFGFGVRSCIGRRIVELELEMMVSKIIENFKIEWTSSEPIRIAPTTLNYITEPFHFVFKDL